VASPASAPAGSRLLQLVREQIASGGSSTAHGSASTSAVRPQPEERCELCGTAMTAEHRHLLELSSRELLCACRPCALLFDRDGAAAGRYKLVPERRLRLDGFQMSDAAWDELRVPVDMAFFFHSSKAERVLAYYPSPMGPTESQLGLDAWQQLERVNPILAELEGDVEALLVNRVRGARGYWLVPLDECYSLVGLIRTRWRGLTGGREVWQQIADFFTDLDHRSRTASRAPRPARQKGAPA
jgi:Family of unknown function (DUF5947)